MRFLIEAQLPPALARALRDEGHEADHLEDVGLRHAKDPEIWEFARTHAYVLITKDEDFVEKYRRQTDGPTLLWLRLGNSSKRALLLWFMPLLPRLVQQLSEGDMFIEVR